MVRLIEVARRAGVSRSTASNVFANPIVVRPALRERVLTAAAELGYAGPDPRGRLLRAGRFGAIAVMPPSEWGVADTLGNPVFGLFLQGIGEICDARGVNLVLTSGRPDRSGPATALADGVIFARVEQLAEIEPAVLRRIPFAVVDFDPGPGIGCVRVDARAGAYVAARHLIGLGHRKFGILSFLRERAEARTYLPGAARPPEAAGGFSDQEKYAGYAAALAEAGLDIAAVPMVQADVYDRSAAARMLDAAPDATAILSMSVMQGVAVVQEARRRGLSVPADISVVGYNDSPEAARVSPPLTTIDGLGREKGRAAAELLFEGAPPRQVVLRPRLIIRQTTAPPR